MSGHTIGGLAAPHSLGFPGGGAPKTPVNNFSEREPCRTRYIYYDHCTCTWYDHKHALIMIIVHACTMLIVYAFTMNIVHVSK